MDKATMLEGMNADLRNENAAIKKENGELKGTIYDLTLKEKELRALISYLNGLGNKPENMTP
jgi:hypothetical protein